MRAWQVSELGEPEKVLQLSDSPRPTPGPGQLLLRVRACALNFPDALMIRGDYQDKPTLPFTPGIELCGVVEEAGEPRAEPPDGGSAPLGSRVMGTAEMPHGALAEFALADATNVFPVPEGLDDAHAAAFTIAYQTGWVALHRRGRLQPGETLLVHAAAGGVGSAAVQLGKAAGARVIAVVGGAEKVEIARRCGADEVIDRTALPADGLIGALKAACGRGGADVVFDPVGGDSFNASTRVVAFEGRILVVGFAGGTIPTVAVNHALVKNYAMVGVYWGLYRARNPRVIREAAQALSQLLAQGKLRPEVSAELPFEQAPAGLSALAAGRTTGRVVIRVAP